MRSSAAFAVLALAGCTVTDVGRPIGIVADGLHPFHEYDLAEAAACWNLAFGVDFRVGAEADTVEQRVEVFYDERTCLSAVAQTQSGWPTTIGICPTQYWDAFPYQYLTMFNVLSHELGHVLNITGHPDHYEEPYAVMGIGGSPYRDMFTAVDVAMFADANPDHAIVSSCERVVRAMEPGFTDTWGRHCACDSGRRLDPDRPVVLLADSLEPPKLNSLRTALSCWNLRYGLALAIRYAEPGDQHVFIGSGYYPSRLVWDREFAMLSVTTYDPLELTDSMADVARLLGVDYSVVVPEVLFVPATDEDMERLYGRSVMCSSVSADEATSTCACLDGAPSP